MDAVFFSIYCLSMNKFHLGGTLLVGCLYGKGIGPFSQIFGSLVPSSVATVLLSLSVRHSLSRTDYFLLFPKFSCYWNFLALGVGVGMGWGFSFCINSPAAVVPSCDCRHQFCWLVFPLPTHYRKFVDFKKCLLVSWRSSGCREGTLFFACFLVSGFFFFKRRFRTIVELLPVPRKENIAYHIHL